MTLTWATASGIAGAGEFENAGLPLLGGSIESQCLDCPLRQFELLDGNSTYEYGAPVGMNHKYSISPPPFLPCSDSPLLSKTILGAIHPLRGGCPHPTLRPPYVGQPGEGLSEDSPDSDSPVERERERQRRREGWKEEGSGRARRTHSSFPSPELD